MNAADEQKVASVIRDDIKPMLDEYVRESLRDPDLAAKNWEYRMGWEAGVRESFAMVLKMMIEKGWR
jgi:hypothetical protein